MTARHAGILGDLFRLRSSGWIISLCLHGSIIFLSGLLAAQIGLAPPIILISLGCDGGRPSTYGFCPYACRSAHGLPEGHQVEFT